jgi:hypothetical protein
MLRTRLQSSLVSAVRGAEVSKGVSIFLNRYLIGLRRKLQRHLLILSVYATLGWTFDFDLYPIIIDWTCWKECPSTTSCYAHCPTTGQELRCRGWR